MPKERNTKDIFWITLIWIMALVLVYLAVIKFRIFLK